MLSDKIKMLFTLKKKSQVEYAKHLGRGAQSINATLKNNRYKLTEFITLCDWLGVGIVLYDHDTNERITDLNINDLKRTS